MLKTTKNKVYLTVFTTAKSLQKIEFHELQQLIIVVKNICLTTKKVVAKNKEYLATTFFVAETIKRIATKCFFATIQLVAKTCNLAQQPKSLLKLLATAVPATMNFVAKNIFSNETVFLATTFFVAKNNFSCSDHWS